MDTLPIYVPVVFIITTFLSAAFLLRAIRTGRPDTFSTNIFYFCMTLWIVFQGVLSIGPFYLDSTVFPPRLLLFAIIPALLFIGAYFIFFRRTFVEKMPLQTLTILHVIRIPVEIVLYWLAVNKTIPIMMTFEGRNFDILSGVLAPVVFFLAFRGGLTNKWLLTSYNILGLALLANVISIAVMSVPSPLQQLNLDQPLIAVLHFPYIWLPALIVPIVLFAHLASLWKLFAGKK